MAGDPEAGDPEADDSDGGSRSAPIDSQVMMHAAALASVSGSRLPGLLDEIQAYLVDRLDEYRRRFERVHEDEERVVFLVPSDHWDSVAGELPLDRREADAVQRAHEQQLRRVGSRTGRREEFETALDIRSAVVVATGGRNPRRRDPR